MPVLAGDRAQSWIDRVETVADTERLRAMWRAAAGEDEGLTREEVKAVRSAIEARVVELENPRTEMGEPQSDAERLRAAVLGRRDADKASPDAPEGEAPATPRRTGRTRKSVPAA
jgi:hypothetical protein